MYDRLLEYILNRISFHVNGQHYLQIKETAKGTNCTLNYANIVKAQIEYTARQLGTANSQVGLAVQY